MKKTDLDHLARAAKRLRASRPLDSYEQRVVRELFRAIGRRGGKARARALTKKQRTESARKAGIARQAKARAAKQQQQGGAQ